MLELYCVRVVLCESCLVLELSCVRVVLCYSCIVLQLYCVTVVLCSRGSCISSHVKSSGRCKTDYKSVTS